MRFFGLFVFIFVAIAFIVTKPVNAANCKQACTDDYNPVCARATNGQFRLFSNKCEFDVESCEVPSAGWKFVKDGHC